MEENTDPRGGGRRAPRGCAHPTPIAEIASASAFSLTAVTSATRACAARVAKSSIVASCAGLSPAAVRAIKLDAPSSSAAISGLGAGRSAGAGRSREDIQESLNPPPNEGLIFFCKKPKKNLERSNHTLPHAYAFE